MDIKRLKTAFLYAWNTDTAYQNFWDPFNPSLNQCAVTTLVAQDYLGGDIVESPMTNGGRHFWNLLTADLEYDFTADQFLLVPHDPIKQEKSLTTREALLENPKTRSRYLILKSRVEHYLDTLQT
jgi:hypothetical protein